MEEKTLSWEQIDVLFTGMEQWASANNITIEELHSVLMATPSNFERMCCTIGAGGTPIWFPCPKKKTE
jgi:hypothetical protein